MSTIDQSRLLQMRSSILNQNDALRRAAGRDVPAEAVASTTPFAQTMTDALQVVSAQQGKAKALSIIIALESSIDFANGGDPASVLQRIYRSAVHRLNEAARTNDAGSIAELRDAISEIAYAWAALAN